MIKQNATQALRQLLGIVSQRQNLIVKSMAVRKPF